MSQQLRIGVGQNGGARCRCGTGAPASQPVVAASEFRGADSPSLDSMVDAMRRLRRGESIAPQAPAPAPPRPLVGSGTAPTPRPLVSASSGGSGTAPSPPITAVMDALRAAGRGPAALRKRI
jgi:hypothetical protein